MRGEAMLQPPFAGALTANGEHLVTVPIAPKPAAHRA